jgi:hypothetical protein
MSHKWTLLARGCLVGERERGEGEGRRKRRRMRQSDRESLRAVDKKGFEKGLRT